MFFFVFKTKIRIFKDLANLGVKFSQYFKTMLKVTFVKYFHYLYR